MDFLFAIKIENKVLHSFVLSCNGIKTPSYLFKQVFSFMELKGTSPKTIYVFLVFVGAVGSFKSVNA